MKHDDEHPVIHYGAHNPNALAMRPLPGSFMGHTIYVYATERDGKRVGDALQQLLRSKILDSGPLVRKREQ
jgi:hypothetical protein